MNLGLVPVLLLAQAILSPVGGVLSPTAPLDLAYRQMYNLQFEDAHRTLQEYERAQPHDPMGPTSRAAAYLFSEFERLGILQTELFVDDNLFEGREKPRPLPEVREAFLNALAQSGRMVDVALARAPRDRGALLAKVLNEGLQADYLAMVEKRDLAAVSRAKRAGRLAKELLQAVPDCYDAYLATGIENYILGLKPAPVRWLLRLYGAETDKAEGLRHLELTAEKGHYLLPYARLLLAVAALRDGHKDRARALLQNLAEEFPNNSLYRKELGKLQ